jgi:hypothetical protein
LGALPVVLGENFVRRFKFFAFVKSIVASLTFYTLRHRAHFEQREIIVVTYLLIAKMQKLGSEQSIGLGAFFFRENRFQRVFGTKRNIAIAM